MKSDSLRLFGYCCARYYLASGSGNCCRNIFSLVTYESGNIRCAAFMHSIWNIFMSSGILNISNEPMENCIFNHVLETNSPLITGGEASVISIVAYLIFIVLAAALIKKKPNKAAV